MNESSGAAAAFRPSAMSSPCAGFSFQGRALRPSKPPDKLTLPASWLSTPRVQVLVAGLTQVLHPLRVPPAARLRRVPVCDTPELPGATDGRGRTNNNRRMRAFPTTPLAALPTAPRPSLSATLIAMKFALERSVGCNFGRDRCNLGLGCLGREGEVDARARNSGGSFLQTNCPPVPHPATPSPLFQINIRLCSGLIEDFPVFTMCPIWMSQGSSQVAHKYLQVFSQNSIGRRFAPDNCCNSLLWCDLGDRDFQPCSPVSTSSPSGLDGLDGMDLQAG